MCYLFAIMRLKLGTTEKKEAKTKFKTLTQDPLGGYKKSCNRAASRSNQKSFYRMKIYLLEKITKFVS